MMRSIVDVIDCAQYVCCNNSAYGAGGVGVSVHNTNAVIGHRNAVQNAGNSLFTSTATFFFANSRRPPHLPAVLLRPFRAPRCVSITSTHSRGRRCYVPVCCPHLCRHMHTHMQRNLHPSAVHTVSLQLDLQWPSHVSRDDWLTVDRHKDTTVGLLFPRSTLQPVV